MIDMEKIYSLKPRYVDNMPGELTHGVLYISMTYEVAIHPCACGCGIHTITPFGTPSGWELTTNADDAVTLRPSIGNQQLPCGSHYWVTDNQIEWL